MTGGWEISINWDDYGPRTLKSPKNANLRTIIIPRYDNGQKSPKKRSLKPLSPSSKDANFKTIIIPRDDNGFKVGGFFGRF